ncbi:MAG: TrmH family RNA methyltransferase [Candidatus Saccharibacteria bacterium]|nr:TrmH family RNA methyltransferase [Candidatus Saccharibacteria bacterium]
MRSREFNKPAREIIVIANNIRSIQNVGSILRTSDCLGINRVYATGYTPNLDYRTDGSNLPLLPHVREKLARELHRAALGAEVTVPFSYHTNVDQLLCKLKNSGYTLVGLEQAPNSIALPDYQPPIKVALLLGEEVHGLTPELMSQCDQLLEIPMFGNKESYNVAVATGIALYSLAL